MVCPFFEAIGGAVRGEESCIAFSVDSSGCTTPDSVLAYVFSTVMMICRIVGGVMSSCRRARTARTPYCGCSGVRASASSRVGIAAPRANQRSGGSMVIWWTQLQLREPQVPHLYRGVRFVCSW